eukprot:GHVQ01036360.1.p1 GENE.GHVQ01036360.1~~GHVQ01036360.1.p1  ORF type:complete len:290 (+),score=65.20 GHVQ01036360.1:586-1455(+)
MFFWFEATAATSLARDYHQVQHNIRMEQLLPQPGRADPYSVAGGGGGGGGGLSEMGGAAAMGAGADMAKSVGQEAYRHAARIGSQLFEKGKGFLSNNRIIGEGPMPLRALCFVGGAAITATSMMYLVFFFHFLTGPAVYILHVYEVLFGITAMVIEAKDMQFLSRFKAFVEDWLKFITVPGGKGAFYFFIGSLGVSLFTRNLALFVAGAYMAVMGIICVLVHFGLQRQLKERGWIDEEDPHIGEEQTSPEGGGGNIRNHHSTEVGGPAYAMSSSSSKVPPLYAAIPPTA